MIILEDELILKNENKTSEKDRKSALLRDIAAAKSDMELARTNFDFVYKPDDVDVYIYKLRDATSRYEKLIKELKEL